MARLLTAQDDPQTVVVREVDLPTLADPDPDVSYTIRLLPERQFQQIKKAHTVRRPKGGAMVEDLDQEAMSAAIVDWVIQDWTGIVARDGDGGLVPVPCDKAAKLGLDPYVRGALVDCATKNQRVEAQAASFRRA
jgi:hypothetical protein